MNILNLSKFKPIQRNISVLFVALALSACSQHNVKATELARYVPTETSDFVHEVSDLQADEGVIYGKLENGVRYAVMHNETPSQTAALRVRFATGSMNETDPQRGLAHFLEHMAFNGTKNIPEGEMVKRLERFGLRFGADTNAHTNFEETVYKLNLPTVSEEILDEAFMIMRETAENMSLNQDAIDRERGIVQSEKRTRDTAKSRASIAMLEFVTDGSGLMDRFPIGTDETLESMDADLFRSYYHDFYRPENTFVVLVGDIEPEQAVAKITETFADWEPVGEPGVKREVLPANTDTGRVGYYSDPELLTEITIASILPFEKKADTQAKRKSDIIENIGRRILNRRLQKLGEDPEANFLLARINKMGLYETAEGVNLKVRSRPENWKLALAVGEQELRRALEFGFTQAELDEQIARLRLAYKAQAGAADTRATVSRFGGGLVTSILNAYGKERVFTHPRTSLERFESYADEITTQDVWDAFKMNWPETGAPMLYLETSEIIENPNQSIRAAYAESAAQEVSAPEDKDIGEFAYVDFGEPGKVVSDVHIADVDAHLVKFDNNVMLNFKQTDFQKDRVSIEVLIGDGGLSMPFKDEAFRRLAYNVMAQGGLEAHSAEDIRTLMAGKAVAASFRVEAETDGFVQRSTTIPADVGDQLGLMVANILAPGFRSEARDNYYKKMQAWFPTHDATASGVLAREVPRLIRSGDKRFGFTNDEQEFYKYTIEQVEEWIRPQLADGMIDITIIGDIDKDAAVDFVASTFGALDTRKSSRGDYPDMTRLKFPQGNTEPVSFTHAGDANRSILRVYWPSPDGTDPTTARQMNILRNVFRNRIVNVIREEEAATYSPGVGMKSERMYADYGYIFVTMDIVPENIPAMIDKIHEISADFQQMNFTQDEFDRAIKPVLESLDSTLENNRYWMGVLQNAQTDTWGIDNFRTREETYVNMTLDDIKPLAPEIFKKENAFHVQVVPAKN